MTALIIYLIGLSFVFFMDVVGIFLDGRTCIYKKGLKETFTKGWFWPVPFTKWIFKNLKKGWDLEKKSSK